MTNGMMNNKVAILEENYKSCVKEGETASFAEWVRLASQSDPNFWHWLFDDDNPELDCGPGDHQEEWEEFLGYIESL